MADGAELHRDAKAIGVAAMLGDKRAIGIVEMKVPGELIGGGLARETSVVACLAVGEKTDRHCSSNLSCRGRGLDGAPLRPRARAAASPAIVRSWMRSRSNSASVAKIPNTSRPSARTARSRRRLNSMIGGALPSIP